MGQSPSDDPEPTPSDGATDESQFKFYNPEEIVEGRTASEWLRFSIALPLAYRVLKLAPDGRVFRPESSSQFSELLDSVFDYVRRAGSRYYSFSDLDVCPQSENMAELFRCFDDVTDRLATAQEAAQIQPLWIAADLSEDPLFLHGGGISARADVFSRAATRVKQVIDAAKKLNSPNVILSAGCEGFPDLYFADTKRDLDQLARFVRMALEHAADIDYTGQFLLSPNAGANATTPYDFSPPEWLNFLRQFGFLESLRLNLQITANFGSWPTMLNHLRFAGMQYCMGGLNVESALARETKAEQRRQWLGMATRVMMQLLTNDGFGSGGITLTAAADSSITPSSVRHEVDLLAQGLKIASALRAGDDLSALRDQHYAGYESDLGKDILTGRADFPQLEEYTLLDGTLNVAPQTEGISFDELIERHMDADE